MKERIQKVLAQAGVCSRRAAEELIRQGRVTIDGRKASIGDQADAGRQQIAVDGKMVAAPEKKVYLMLNKPKGVVSATEDKEQTTVVDLVPDELMRKGLFPAGRLDKDTTGLLILTDDGDFAHEILSPKKHVQKVYLAKVNGSITDEIIEAFRTGVNVHNEYTTLPSKLSVVSREEDGDWGKVILREGMYHQIKRMFVSFGLKVVELHRIRMGRLDLDESLEPGQCRPLTAEEVQLLNTREEIAFED